MAGLESVRITEGEQLMSRARQGHREATSSQATSHQARSHASTDVAAGPALPVTHAQEALTAFDRDVALPPVPDAPELIAQLLRNALVLIENREHGLAMNLLRNVLMRRPNEPRALRWLGHCLRETNRLEDAMKCFKALVTFLGDDESQLLYADSLYMLGRDTEAVEVYQRLLGRLTDTSPALFDVYKNLGNIHVRAGDFEAAEECYNKANTLSCESDILMVNYGTLEIQRENFSEAVERFRRAVEINASNDKGWVGLAMVHRQMGDFELARANVERSLDINPRNKTALHLLAEWDLSDRDFTASVRRLVNYLEMESEDVEMSFLLARILTHLGRLQEAVLEMERVLGLDPMIEGGAQLMTALQAGLRRRTENA
ncbi:MAG: tetratricopeptide repeat protein [Bdellovibrionaceae bacterium]|nr:tetratricopeptide repeat protein [Pseudobdellovibrionaceae bacterium]